MSFLGKGKKCDLLSLAKELEIEVADTNVTVLALKTLIMKSESYEEEFVKTLLETIISTRKEDEVKEAERSAAEVKKREMELAAEAKKEEMEFEFKKLQLEAETKKSSSGERIDRNVSVNTLLELSRSMPKFDAKGYDIIHYLSLFEKQAKRFKIEEKDWVSSLLSLMPPDIVELIARISESEFENYLFVKDILLKKFRLTAEGFRQKFVQHQRNPDKNWKDFVYEVTNYFQGWLDGLDIKDFDSLKDLIITDQIKRRVPYEIRDHFVDSWAQIVCPSDLASRIDEYESVRRAYKKQNISQMKYNSNEHSRNVAKGSLQDNKRLDAKPHTVNAKARPKFTCYSCGKDGHTKKFCPELSRTKVDLDVKRKATVSNTIVEKDIEKKETKGGTAVVAKVVTHKGNVLGEKLCDLERIDVSVNGRPAKALIDSGTEITVVRKDIVSGCQLQDKPSIFIKGIFGPAEKCPLVNIPMSLILGGQTNVIHHEVLCAVTPSLVEDVLMPPEIRNVLSGCQGSETVDNMTIQEGKDEIEVVSFENSSGDEEGGNRATSLEAQAIEVSEEDDKLAKSELFQREQETCEELQEAKKQAELGTGGFYIHNKFLFHKEKVLGETICQLVLPKNRRNEVMKLAHCSVFGGHMGAKKTTERIRYSFYWTGLSKDVRRFCQLCQDCQMTRRVQQRDRTPITPITRPGLPFQVVNVDLIGPIQPRSSNGHRYILCMVDQHTRWAEAIPLTSLNAKATCDALLSIFMRTGIPNVIASDNGTNFNSALTQEFERRIGSSPRFSTPSYPQSNGLVERFNQTLKRMLHHVIREEPRKWHTKIPFILWAYREVPNSTTGVAPFQLLYGRKPEGPLSILKNTWSGKLEALQLDTTPVSTYMEKLKAQLEDAAEKAKITSEIQQEKMAYYYNLRSSKKTFKPGDKVIVLIPDSNNKLLARWQGPGVIESKKNEHSFFVKMPDNSVKHVHQNKIREFVSANSNSVQCE